MPPASAVSANVGRLESGVGSSRLEVDVCPAGAPGWHLVVERGYLVQSGAEHEQEVRRREPLLH